MKFIKKTEITGHVAAVYSCCASPNFIYSASSDKHVVRWLIETGEQDKFAIKFDFPVYSIELIEDNFLVAGLSSGDLHVFDLKKNQEVKFYQQHKSAIFSIRNNTIKNQLYVGDADGNFSIWDSKTLELIIYLPLDCGKIRSISVNRTGEHFSIACQDGFIRVFETSYFNEINSMSAHKNGVTSILFHPEKEDLIISGGKDALLKIWNWKNEEELNSIVAHTFSIYDLISIENGKKIVSASRDKHVKIWSLNDSDIQIEERLDLKSGGHKHSVNSLSKINESSFISCSDDKKVIVWKQ